MISVIVPNRNGAATLEECLEALFSSEAGDFEVIVVDDASEDGSLQIIRKYPCRLIRLERPSGAAAARNAGALAARGRYLFFTDADCVVGRHTLRRAAAGLAASGTGAVVGGTYTPEPSDAGFFSRFQSVFINYSETKHGKRADYVATHAMAVDAQTFRKSGGFREEFLPILEDVEFSHRLRRSGCRLVMDPGIQVSHIFNFSLSGSVRNAMRKSAYWTSYSLWNGDLLTDSGTASLGLKVNVTACFITALLVPLIYYSSSALLVYAAGAALAANAAANWGLFRAFRRTGGRAFALLAGLYYLSLFAMAVGLGAALGMTRMTTVPFRSKEIPWFFHRSDTRAR